MELGKKKKSTSQKLTRFLQANPLAKIIIVVDTHSSQDGLLVEKIEKNMTSTDLLGKVCGEI